jgi:hypothetical protein
MKSYDRFFVQFLAGFLGIGSIVLGTMFLVYMMTGCVGIPANTISTGGTVETQAWTQHAQDQYQQQQQWQNQVLQQQQQNNQRQNDAWWQAHH